MYLQYFGTLSSEACILYMKHTEELDDLLIPLLVWRERFYFLKKIHKNVPK